MKNNLIKLTQIDKILLTLYDLSGGKKINIKFEDIVVGIFKKYKSDFHLKGYPQYPDSENVNKAVYRDLRRNGLVVYGNRNFALTEKGIEYVEELQDFLINKKVSKKISLSRLIENELHRISKLDGFQLFKKGSADKIVDTDFYNYLGCSVRTPKDQLLGRLNVLTKMIETLSSNKVSSKNFYIYIEYYNYLVSTFSNIISYYEKK